MITSCGKKGPDIGYQKSERLNEDLIVTTDSDNGKMFDILTGESTGMTFRNDIETNFRVNFYNSRYVYNGSGVGIGDFNNDGLPDVYMGGNWVSDRLYLNKGDLKFEDISEASGIAAHDSYTTGVSVVDINSDGWLDIYVCRNFFTEEGRKQDMLFINNGDLTFTESSKEYGLYSDVYTTQANFFDFDNDGDLDLYLITHPDDWNDVKKLKYYVKIENGTNESDKFFRNDNGKFTEIHLEAGINNHAYGLSGTVGDFDMNGFLDIYVANDFIMNDFLYMNNGDGTFTEEVKNKMGRNSQFTMGTDVVDMNNDGLLDIYTVDMDMEDQYTDKTFNFVTNKETLDRMVNAGYHIQYVGNTLQLNDAEGNFNEVARFANISTTGWSWSPLLVDYDNDGDRDIFITNGFARDFHVDNTSGYNKLRRATRIKDSVYYMQLLEDYPTVPLTTPNALFENMGDLVFEDRRSDWGVYYPSASYGGAYGDLDGDGDVDIVVNNLNEKAFIYRNNSEKINPDNKWLRIKLNGPAGNSQGFGTWVELYNGDEVQYHQVAAIRGFQSCSENTTHFGLGKMAKADKVIVRWMDGKGQIFTDVEANQILNVDYADATDIPAPSNGKENQLFAEVGAGMGIDYQHVENKYDDFNREFLIPHKLSFLGAGVAVADVNGDGMEDFFVGGAQNSTGQLYLQAAGNTFNKAPISALEADKICEDMGALFFDADGDNDMDLYVASGGSDYSPNVPELQDRLYINDGNGGFSKADGALPEMYNSSSCVVGQDYDGDGDVDLFVGGRVLPGSYPESPRSYLLRNDGGKFSDVTAEIAPGLEKAGLISGAIWTDYDNDNKPDLALVGEWTPLILFHNTGSGFENTSAAAGVDELTGWWNSITGGDFDGDGDIDLVAGNFGVNCKYKPSEEGPIEVFMDDFDGNGTNEILLAYYQQGKCWPVKSRERVVEAVPSLQESVPTWDQYGKSTIYDLFGKEKLEASKVRANAAEFLSYYFQNNGDGTYTATPAHRSLQVSGVFGMVSFDFDGDGNLDLLSHGNFYHPEVETNRQDASHGQLLLGNGDGSFRAPTETESGFYSHMDAKGLALIGTGNGTQPLVLATNNNGPMKAYENRNSDQPVLKGNHTDSYAVVTLGDGRKMKVEFYKGSGYLSQNSPMVRVPKGAKSVVFGDQSGNERQVWPSLQANK